MAKHQVSSMRFNSIPNRNNHSANDAFGCWLLNWTIFEWPSMVVSAMNSRLVFCLLRFILLLSARCSTENDQPTETCWTEYASTCAHIHRWLTNEMQKKTTRNFAMASPHQRKPLEALQLKYSRSASIEVQNIHRIHNNFKSAFAITVIECIVENLTQKTVQHLVRKQHELLRNLRKISFTHRHFSDFTAVCSLWRCDEHLCQLISVVFMDSHTTLYA